MQIGELMAESGVSFGTSGARGLVEDMTDRVCYAYTLGFLQYLTHRGDLLERGEVGIAGDLRSSTGRILASCIRAMIDRGFAPRYLGRIPSPALAAYAFAQGMPSMMVTGSHIPDDRNGIKFNLPCGEILKEDELGMRAQEVTLPAGLFDQDGCLAADRRSALPDEEGVGLEAYAARYLDFFPAGCLSGMRVGSYEHSGVAREPIYTVLTGLGAEVDRLGYSDQFIPVDTEAIRAEDVELARQWAGGGRYDALVSADGDGDRPLIADEQGRWLRGDIAGILCARALGAKAVATPVSCNTAVEKSGWFERVLRTRIGSPYVIAGMEQLRKQGFSPVVGYEANGGFLTASDIVRGDKTLPALPTRDAVLVLVSILELAQRRGSPVSRLAADLPQRFTVSDRIKNFPTELSRGRLRAMTTGDVKHDTEVLNEVFGEALGQVAQIDTTDGLRLTFNSGEIAHIRPSGNAPELRAYTEADSPQRAAEINRVCMQILSGWRDS